MDAERLSCRGRGLAAAATVAILVMTSGRLEGQVNNYVVGPQDVLTIASTSRT
jgi:hypothetical protein